MPKSIKRAATKRAERIARAHSTTLPKLEVNDPEQRRRRSPSYKAPARGIARYPWATIIVLCLILGTVVFFFAANRVGPFASLGAAPSPTAVTTPGAAQPSATAGATTSSPLKTTDACLNEDIIKSLTKTSPVPTADDVKKINHSYPQADNVIDQKKIYCAGINTNRGLIVVELNPEYAPKTVNNFVFLAQKNYFDGLTFHRVLKEGLMIAQGGDPKGDGTGGPGYKFADEPVKGEYEEGTLAMANSGANTNGSQFFINTGDNSKALQKSYNLFGKIVKGLDVAKKLQGPSDTDKNIKPDVMYYVKVVPAS